jgi:hypothetical protein
MSCHCRFKWQRNLGQRKRTLAVHRFSLIHADAPRIALNIATLPELLRKS